MTNGEDRPQTKSEAAKAGSDSLRGTLAETIASDATHFSGSDLDVLKFHGVYQQDDRDHRRERRAQGLGKAHQFMIRCAIPGGVLTTDQYLALDHLSERHGNGTLRVTTRQGIQFHGVVKDGLKKTIAGIHESLLTTLGACGDVSRNVVSCPAPLAGGAHETVRTLTRQIAERLRPATGAYHEIWLDGEKAVSSEPEEPFYGSRYLPRKFKVGLALSSHSCIDLPTHDCGLLAIVEGDRVRGFDLSVGGGLGMTHRKADTFARLAEPLGFVEVESVVEAVQTVAAIFRDHGNRSDRRHARLKYLIAEWGMERFQAEFRSRAAFSLAPPKAEVAPSYGDHLGNHRQGDGKWFHGICIENGRIADSAERRTRSALRKIVVEHAPRLVLTPQQNILVTDLPHGALDAIVRTLRDHGVTPADELSSAKRHAIACPALPTCGLAITESERIMPTVVGRIESELDALGLRDVPLTVRMTGCPNGCAKPYTADVAFVGSGKDAYHVYIGGGLKGDRMVDLYANDVATNDLVPTLRPLLELWSRKRRNEESLGDFYQRLTKRDQPRRSITGREEPTIDGLIEGAELD